MVIKWSKKWPAPCQQPADITRDGALRLAAWENLLPQNDPKRHFILTGIQEGFHIINTKEFAKPVFVNNYKSATNPEVRDLVEEQIKIELREKRYQIIDQPARITSALGAIPKKEKNKVRLIHDASRPSGYALNDYARNNPFQYQSISDAVKHVTPQAYLAKIDLANAYRSVKIHPSNFDATGIHWTFQGDNSPTYMVDTRLPFGARRSPEIFHELTQAVCRIMSSEGYPSVIAYLDDFLIIGETYSQCLVIMTRLLKLLRLLGFSINYNKVHGPAQRLTFLGITLDTNNMTLELPEDRLQDISTSLSTVYKQTKVSKRQLMSLAGKLNWASQVIYGGRFHLRRLLDSIQGLKMPGHRRRVTREMRKDIIWWLQFLSVFNGSQQMIDTQPTTSVCTDACNTAAGAFHQGQFIYTPWSWWPEMANLHINFKEIVALEPAVALWAPFWSNKTVYIHCDNQTAVRIINKGSCKNVSVMDSLRRIFWWSAIYNFKIHAVYIPGAYNQIADCISRLHDFNRCKHLFGIMKSCYNI